jgi:hippurate hydrolase
MEKLLALVLLLLIIPKAVGQRENLDERILKLINTETDQYRRIYRDLHKNPELSTMEFETSGKMAEELKSIGFDVTSGVGGTGVVGIFKNGEGKVIMLRTDMDALPVIENSGLDFSSRVLVKDASGKESPAMHACGHDLHMAVWLGTLKTLIALKSDWKGTIVAVAQPAEEISDGSIAMIRDSLFQRFPKPDLALCYHVSAELPAGTIGYFPGPIFAGVSSAEITVYGRGGHGALPHTTIDPVILSASIILDIQTIVSREINPVKPAVITVGAIHGGTRPNIIPDEVRMLLTMRFFDEVVYDQIRTALLRITKGDAVAAGLPEDKMPLVEFENPYTPPVVNDPDLVLKSVEYMKEILGNENLTLVDPAMVAEDFGQYGRTKEKIPIALFWLGGVNQNKYKDHIANGTHLPPLHSSSFVPDFDPAFKCGVSAMTRTVIDLLRNKK